MDHDTVHNTDEFVNNTNKNPTKNIYETKQNDEVLGEKLS